MSPVISEEALAGARQLLLQMHGGSQFLNLNELRDHLYCSRDIRDLRALPLTKNAFEQFMLRALYQIYTWKTALATDTQLPSPTDYGWSQEGCKLLPRYLTQPHSPPNLRRQAPCRCQKRRCVKSCPYIKTGPCTIACLCGGKAVKCDRLKQHQLDDSAVSDSDTEDIV